MIHQLFGTRKSTAWEKETVFAALALPLLLVAEHKTQRRAVNQFYVQFPLSLSLSFPQLQHRHAHCLYKKSNVGFIISLSLYHFMIISLSLSHSMIISLTLSFSIIISLSLSHSMIISLSLTHSMIISLSLPHSIIISFSLSFCMIILLTLALPYSKFVEHIFCNSKFTGL